MNALLRFPVRWSLPIVLLALGTLTAFAIFLQYRHETAREVENEVRENLRERLAIEQTRLEIQLGQGNLLLIRRIVSSLGLRPDLTHAWLIHPNGRVVAAHTRLDLDQPWDEIRHRQPDALAAALARPCPDGLPIALCRPASAEFLIAQLNLRTGHRLLVVEDLAAPIARRLATAQSGLALQIGTVFLFALLMGAALHHLWGKRMIRLEAAAGRFGDGDFTARALLPGADELARIGAAFDRMAERLARQRDEIRRLASLVEQSPLVAIVWHNAPGWPVEFVSDNVVRWGLDKDALLSGKVLYADLIHPGDLPAITADVEQHLAHGPDRYVQVYRLRDGFGHWRWIEDHTWLLRDENGQVQTIRGVLLDITSRREAEQLQHRQSAEIAERNAELERFVAAAIGREEEMIRLKREIDALCRELGRPAPYDLSFLGEEERRR